MTQERVYWDSKIGCWVARVELTAFNDRPMWRIRFYATEARAIEAVQGKWDR